MLNTIIHQANNETTKAPPLVIAHGLFGSARNWGVIGKRMASRGDVIAPDMRNHGLSFWSPNHSYDEMAQDLADVIDANCGGQADLVGHSMGGKAAMMLALRHPDKLRRLVVADIAPVAYTHSQQSMIDAMRRVDPAVVKDRAEAKALMGVENAAVAAFLLQSLDLKAKKWRVNLDALQHEMPKILSFPELDGQFEGPVLFLSGAASTYVLPAYRSRIKALFPRAYFAKIPKAGHWLHAEEPRKFEAALRSFLDS